jgi:6-phosphogluconolactonase/glucosamine-6-phosphate isomerase/deaminase
VAELLAKSLSAQLKTGRRVLWLISGGSVINLATIAAKKLTHHNLDNLSVSLIDERYGPPGHKDSNWRQLMAAGFSLPGAQLYPILINKNIEATTSEFDDFIKHTENSYKIGLLGVGVDGHTAGLLPGSPALSSDRYADYYQGPDFWRISLTPKALVTLDEALVFALGQSKAQALADLQKDLPISRQPAQIIKQIPKVAVYNDLVGETI